MIAPRSAMRALGRTVPALAALVLTATSPLSAAQGPPAAVRVDAAREERVTDRRPVTGDIRAARRGEVATREKGLVSELLVREGDVVEAGAVLARLDATQLELDRVVLQAQRPPSEARVRELEANLLQANNDLESVRTLVEKKAANPKELLDAEAVVTAAQARLAASEAQLSVIDAQLAKLAQRIEDTRIVAPFAGTIVRRMTEVGSWLGEGDALVELLSTSDLEVWLEVPQDLFAATAAHSGSIEVRLGGGRASFALDDYAVIPDVNVRGRTFRLKGPATTDLPLASGMSVTALVPTGEEKSMLTIHRDAILRNAVSEFVYAVIPGGEGAPARAAPMDVEVLFQTPTRAVVRSSSLRPGMQVVTEGNERLYPMAAIIPNAAPAGGAPGQAGGGAEGGAPPKQDAPQPKDAKPQDAKPQDAQAPAQGDAGQLSKESGSR